MPESPVVASIQVAAPFCVAQLEELTTYLPLPKLLTVPLPTRSLPPLPVNFDTSAPVVVSKIRTAPAFVATVESLLLITMMRLSAVTPV